MLTRVIRDVNAKATGAGVTAFIWYAFGAVPLHIAVAGQLGLNSVESSSWVFIVWTSGAASSIALSLYYRQPIPITWSIPGLIYLGTLAGQFSYGEMVGANIVAGVLILLFGILGLGSRLMAVLPLPIVMGMFAGSIVSYATRLVQVTADDLAIAGPTVAGYLVGQLLHRSKLPPIGLAVLFGGVAVAIVGAGNTVDFVLHAPAVSVPSITFSLQAVAAISFPMVILALGLGNVQGLGFLIGQGYRVPINQVSTVVGGLSIVNALFGGHASIVARTGVAILAGEDAGPKHSRYTANLIAATLTLSIALASGLVIVLLALLPEAYVFALAGLAIFSSLQGAFEQAFSSQLRYGALVAFVTAATPFAIVGISSAFWAIVIGIAASFIAERDELIDFWGLNRRISIETDVAGAVPAKSATSR